jgi:hypothetical protein
MVVLDTVQEDSVLPGGQARVVLTVVVPERTTPCRACGITIKLARKTEHRNPQNLWVPTVPTVAPGPQALTQSDIHRCPVARRKQFWVWKP